MIRKAEKEHICVLTDLALALWPGHEQTGLESELAAMLHKPDAVCFLAWEDASPAAFAQCQLRRDYVEGTDSSPVGYLEGIYVRPEFRGRGIASGLLRACQAWAKEQGCTEFASDCELTNYDSLAFHLRQGFEEANRIICFVKKL